MPPLGVHLVPGGIDVAVLASHASGVDLCLIDPGTDPGGAGTFTERRVALDGPVHGVWTGHVPGIQAGQRYGFRAHGAWDPASGLRHNPAKLLVDPYARGLVGELDYAGPVYSTGPGGERDDRDSLAHVPHSVVVPDPGPLNTKRPYTPWAKTVVYEAHVKGFTKLASSLPPELRGTYAGLAHPTTIEHLRSLGVTTVELLPIHAKIDEPGLVAKGLTNYWGYSTLGFFAPNPDYATQAAQDAGPAAVLDEVRGMVYLLHEAGIEVVLDVVYNHTCEGGQDGLHVSWRGLDNTHYYMHDGGIPARLANVTGCGNTLDFRRSRVVQMALDSLRYWARVVGVDGFRFDLAVTLARGAAGYEADHPFLVALQTDPVLSRLKLIAEPWDIGPGGWRTGEFPAPFAEWNDKFRDAVRQFWLADAAEMSHGRTGNGARDLATRLAGSADTFGYSDPPYMRGPVASINFVTAHDGFTLADLVTYEHKRNEDNGEAGRDGTDNNRSWNHGFEGPAPVDGTGFERLLAPGVEIAPLRRRSMRNMAATLILAAGTPMITAGDELGRSQRGNNNAYAQDNDVSWMAWGLATEHSELMSTVRRLLALRRDHAALRPVNFYHGRPAPHSDVVDLSWFAADGSVLTSEAWHDERTRTLQMLRAAPGPGDRDVLLIINGALDPVGVVLPSVRPHQHWEVAWASEWEHPLDRDDMSAPFSANDVVGLEALSLHVYLSVVEPAA